MLILGTGFAGLAVARGLARRSNVRVTVVDRENYTLFTPMLPEVASGSIEPRHIAQPLRSALPHCTFELGEVASVDFAQRTVEVHHPILARAAQIEYDHLVIALGAATTTHGVPGAADHTFPLKSLDDAVKLRDRVIGVLESAASADDEAERRRLLRFVIVGGGFTGVEAAGELLGFLRSIARYYPSLDAAMLCVVLVAGSGRILEQLPERFGTRAQDMLTARGVEVVLDDDVAAVDAGGLALKSGARYETRTVIWSAGVRPAPILESFDLERSKHGAVVVNADFSVPNRPGVWAVGDCAQIPRASGGSYPHTAQDAIREGPVLALNIAAAIASRPTKPFHYRSLGMMASLGDRQGLADIGHGHMLSGFPAWLLWRAYYLSRMPGIERRARVTLDWTFSLPFPGDIARIR